MCVTTAINEIEMVMNYIDFTPDDYGDEYALILSIEDDLLMLSIEKAKHNNGEYKTFEEDYVYINDECSNELILRQIAYEGDTDIFAIGVECE